MTVTTVVTVVTVVFQKMSQLGNKIELNAFAPQISKFPAPRRTEQLEHSNPKKPKKFSARQTTLSPLEPLLTNNSFRCDKLAVATELLCHSESTNRVKLLSCQIFTASCGAANKELG
jgi:hypothetical protein